MSKIEIVYHLFIFAGPNSFTIILNVSQTFCWVKAERVKQTAEQAKNRVIETVCLCSKAMVINTMSVYKIYGF